jgi:hypothetical protein
MSKHTLLITLLATLSAGCASTPIITTLPPALCKPATDLPAHKNITKLPEVETPNDQFYSLFLQERAQHAKDAQDYNSLYATCVDPSQKATALNVFAN